MQCHEHVPDEYCIEQIYIRQSNLGTRNATQIDASQILYYTNCPFFEISQSYFDEFVIILYNKYWECTYHHLNRCMITMLIWHVLQKRFVALMKISEQMRSITVSHMTYLWQCKCVAFVMTDCIHIAQLMLSAQLDSIRVLYNWPWMWHAWRHRHYQLTFRGRVTHVHVCVS